MLDSDKLSEIVGDIADLKPLVVSCFDENPASMLQISVTLKEAKDNYNLQLKKCSDDNNPIE